jgi:hypothetical protein
VQLEGRLAGPVIIEAERCWQATRRDYPDRPIRIDLRAVTFLGKEGKAFLQQAFRQGASFLTSGCLTRSYVEEILRSDQE